MIVDRDTPFKVLLKKDPRVRSGSRVRGEVTLLAVSPFTKMYRYTWLSRHSFMCQNKHGNQLIQRSNLHNDTKVVLLYAVLYFRIHRFADYVCFCGLFITTPQTQTHFWHKQLNEKITKIAYIGKWPPWKSTDIHCHIWKPSLKIIYYFLNDSTVTYDNPRFSESNQNKIHEPGKSK